MIQDLFAKFIYLLMSIHLSKNMSSLNLQIEHLNQLIEQKLLYGTLHIGRDQMYKITFFYFFTRPYTRQQGESCRLCMKCVRWLQIIVINYFVTIVFAKFYLLAKKRKSRVTFHNASKFKLLMLFSMVRLLMIF